MIGLSTYAFFWQISERAPEAPGLNALLPRTRELGAQVFQICDYPPLQTYSDAQLADLKKNARDLGITLELGTKGVQHEHLMNYLRVADRLGAKLIRSMVNAPDHRPTLSEAEKLLRTSIPAYEASGVMLALETYEQLSSSDIVALVESVGSKNLGICLDPANCVANLEHPLAVIDRCAPYVANLHVKDFAFTRRGGWVGFTLEGCELGKGLLPYDYMIGKVDPEARGINQVVEHWLTWQDDYEKTARIENEWNAHNLERMRRSVETDSASRQRTAGEKQ
ncbi:sugar phosphate isomerase [Betaproteobacteria bacterium]|nr:sugar phosphate isomerase [Betaproteobacteria bacterium]